MNEKVYGYIRVSTQKQGREGVSLEAQKEAIARYASTHNLNIVEWFEEQESAAKKGRYQFGRMITLLRNKKASGFICHKLDRTTRNLGDWIVISELSDHGIKVHFAHESLDLNSLSGKLTADIQAAIAAHYSRNLRDEVKKGLLGRLKQGFYPHAAPIGYLNNGGGKAKTIDPVKGPLIKMLFELYATAEYGLDGLRKIMLTHGLHNGQGKPIALGTVSKILNNPFYYGILRYKDSEYFLGVHEPLIGKALFDRCQTVLKKAVQRRSMKHDLPYRMRIECANCQNHLIGEVQKGRAYYRCHGRECHGTSVTEVNLDQFLWDDLHKFIPLFTLENDILLKLKEFNSEKLQQVANLKRNSKLEMASIEKRLDALLELYLSQSLTKEEYETKKRKYLEKKQAAMLASDALENDKNHIGSTGFKLFVELKNALKNMEKMSKLEVVRKNTFPYMSNFSVSLKTPYILWVSPFSEIKNLVDVSCGEHLRDPNRLVDEIVKILIHDK